MDIASLGIEIKTDSVERATADLNELATAGAKAETSVGKVGDAGDQAAKGMAKAGNGTQAALREFERARMSAAQTSQAIRMLPAQFSDIFISLQGGQAPLSVFLQQGSQIKDSFGGVGPALRETARYAAGLVNPFTIGATAVAALGLAAYQGSEELRTLQKSLLLTNDYAGKSAEQLSVIAKQYAEIFNTSQRSATSILASVAGSGSFTGTQFDDVSRAAIAMKEAVGRSVEDTVSEFRKLGEDPAFAAAKLNNQYHILTASTYEQIKALEDQGDKAGAASLAISTFADAQVDMALKVKKNLGLLEEAWNAAGRAASGAWDAMLDIGRTATLEDQLLEQQEKLKRLQQLGSGKGIFDNSSDRDRTNQEIQRISGLIAERDRATQAKATANTIREEALSAYRYIEGLEAKTESNADKRRKATERYMESLEAIRKDNPASELLKPESIAAMKKAIAEQYKDPRATKVRSFQDDEATRMLISLKEQQSALGAQLLTENKLTAEQKKRAEFEALIVELKTKGTLTADQKSLLANQDAIKAQLDKNAALSEEVRLHQESIKFQERSAQIQEAIANAADQRQEQYQRTLEGAGQGSRARERIQEQNSIQREFRRYEEQLTRKADAGLIGSDEYAQGIQKIRDGYQKALLASVEFYRQDDKNREDWANGVGDAFADYTDYAKDASAQSYDLFTNAFHGIEDTITEFVMTGKGSFTDLANSIIADLIRIETRKAIAFAIGGSDGNGGASGLLTTAFSAASSYFSGGAAASSLAAGSTQAGYAMDLSKFAAGRAAGGPVAANQLYEVGENNNPEILKSGGKNYLIPGNNGNVVPMKAGGGGTTNMVFVLPSVTDRQSAKEASGLLGRNISRVVAGAGRYS